jgi:hypothetical protein
MKSTKDIPMRIVFIFIPHAASQRQIMPEMVPFSNETNHIFQLIERKKESVFFWTLTPRLREGRTRRTDGHSYLL